MTDPDGVFGKAIAARYDEASAERFEPAELDPTVDLLARLAGDGAALELAIGTGRVALPLARRGVPVHGIDMSRAMVDRLRAILVEAMIPELRRLPPGEDVLPFRVSAGSWAYDQYDTATQLMSSNYLQVIDGRAEFTTYPFRYVWPAEMDLMAELAGMRPRARWGGWSGEPFTSASERAVSVWEKPAA